MKKVLIVTIGALLLILSACQEPKKEVKEEPKNDKYSYECLDFGEDNFILFRLNTYTGEVFVRNGANGSWYEATSNNNLSNKVYKYKAYEILVQKVGEAYRLELCNKIDGSVLVRSQSSGWYDASIK